MTATDASLRIVFNSPPQMISVGLLLPGTLPIGHGMRPLLNFSTIIVPRMAHFGESRA